MQFTSVTRGRLDFDHSDNVVSQVPIARQTAAIGDGLGPQLAAPASRRVLSDDEAPWVVGESPAANPDTGGKITVAGIATSTQAVSKRE